MGELGFDNILGENDIENLFITPDAPSTEEAEDQDSVPEQKEETTEETTEVTDPETLFEEEVPESVGSGNGKDKEKKGDTVPDEGSDTSPNFYSSIANALAVDGIFLNSDDENVGKVNDAESFKELIEAEINARLDERQQRVAKALDNGVEPTDIRKYENTLNFINSISDAAIAEESEKGEQLRRNLIFQDFLNKGYSQDKAQKFTERTISAGTDIEDAREALQSNREFFQKAYNSLLQNAQLEADRMREERRKTADKLKDSLMKDKQLFGDIEISNDIRKKTFENISKPVYRDTETGEYLTAIQKYEMEHRGDFLKYAGLFFTLTNGFKDFDSFTKGKVKKELNKGLKELEHTLNNSVRHSSGNLKLVTSASDDADVFIGKGMKLDL